MWSLILGSLKNQKKNLCLFWRRKQNLRSFIFKNRGRNGKLCYDFPSFLPKRRLKIGTFKTESTGFRLGERFLKIAFDYAALANIDEIYVTMYPSVGGLKELLENWGFIYWGKRERNSC